jgi:hypothetical protein
MFDTFNGIPLHPLAVHAAVVLVPLAALMGILFAIPRTRAWSRLPLLLTSLAALVAVYVSKESGEPLEESLNLQGNANDLIEEHAERADQLFVLMIVFTLIAVIAFVLTRTANVSTLVTNVLATVLVLGSIGVAIQTYRVGDIGARAVWNPSSAAGQPPGSD